MRQGYIDSQGNKYILTGVKAQFPRWTYAEWQAEGEPDIPWIWIDAPSGYRKVSGDDVSYDNTSSVNDKIDDVEDSTHQKYPNLNLTNPLGTEEQKAILYASGNVGFVSFAFTCRSATQETITVALPSGWSTISEGVVIRDNDNGNLVLAYVNSTGVLTTFNHTGTMTVGHLFFASMKAVKRS